MTRVFCAMTVQWEGTPNQIRVASYSTIIENADGLMPSDIYYRVFSKAATALGAPLAKMASLFYYAAEERPVGG
jgi:hypothetical protein